jgi:septum formation protein
MKTAKPGIDPKPPAGALILASASGGRAAILRNAGLTFHQKPANIDERALEDEILRRDGRLEAGRLSLELASEKARAVSALHPDALVIGADQVMVCGGLLFAKPVDIHGARKQLSHLLGKAHNLHSAVAVALGGDIHWQHVEKATLTMRAFSEAFLDDYLAAEGEAVLASVGAYRIEGRGIQLFSRVEGDHFTIIGLPLLPLLGYLREGGWLPT